MKQTMKMLTLTGLVSAAQGESVAPVQRVLEMLQNMKERGVAEKNTEQVQYTKYKGWCSSEKANKDRTISELTEGISLAEAAAAKAEATAKDLETKIAELEASLTKWAKEKEDAVKTREAEKEEYTSTHKDYTANIDAIANASKVLKTHEANKESKKAIAMLSGSRLIDQATTKKLNDYLAHYHSDSSLEADLQKEGDLTSGSIIDLLDKLHDKFSDERMQVEKDEISKTHVHELYLKDVESQVKTATDSKTAKASTRSKLLEDASYKKGELKDLTSTKKDNDDYLKEVTGNCADKAKEFGIRQELRAQEIEAIEKAVDTIKFLSPKSLLQTKAATALLQLETSNPAEVEKVIAYLQSHAAKLDSRLLSSTALKVKGSPVNKATRAMIEKLIERLEDEMNSSTDHDQWCSEELTSNGQTRRAGTLKVEGLQEELEATKARVEKYGADSLELKKKVAEITGSFAEADKQRADSKAANEAAIKDAKDVQAAINNAMTVLKEFYSKSASLLQGTNNKKMSGAPEIFSGEYKGQQSNGVIAMLEDIHADNVKLETTAKAQEASDESSYQEQRTEAKILQTQTEKDLFHKAKQQVEAKTRTTTLKEDLASAQKELETATTYYDKLKDSCLNSGPTAKEREERRKEEIASLKEALAMLS